MAGIGKYKKGAKFTLRSGNKPSFFTMGSSPLMAHEEGHGKTKEDYLNEGFSQVEADQMMKTGATTGDTTVNKGKIVHKDGKKYWQAPDGTLHTGQVSDYETEKKEDEKSAAPKYKSPAKQKKDQQKIVGEQTGKIKTDKEGQKYVLQDYDTDYGAMEGDTIQLSPDAPVVGEYLMGGDYYGKETEGSKKRKKGPKTYKVNIEK